MNYERFELPNGLTLLAAPMPSMRSATSALFVNVGSRWESSREAGIAHLTEHLMFKGTTRRRSARAISETLEQVGGVLNASTDKEATVYWTKTAAEHLDLSLDLLADMVQNSRLTPTDLRKEQTVIVEELGMSMDDPQDWVHSMIDDVMWPDHPLGRDVAGTRESVQQLTRPQIREFVHQHYASSNALLVVAGGIDHSKVQDMAVRHFGGWTRMESTPYPGAPAFGKSSHQFDERSTEQAHICLGFPGLNRHHPDRYALDLLSTILGGSATSRLFLEVRENLALAYDVHVYTTKMADTGSVVVYAGVDPLRAKEAYSAIIRQIERLKSRSVAEAELTKTIEFMKGRLALALEDTHAVVSWLGSQLLLTGKIQSPETVVGNLESLRPRDLRRVANDIFQFDRMRIAAIGPHVGELQFAQPR